MVVRVVAVVTRGSEAGAKPPTRVELLLDRRVWRASPAAPWPPLGAARRACAPRAGLPCSARGGPVWRRPPRHHRAAAARVSSGRGRSRFSVPPSLTTSSATTHRTRTRRTFTRGSGERPVLLEHRLLPPSGDAGSDPDQRRAFLPPTKTSAQTAPAPTTPPWSRSGRPRLS